MLWKLKVKVWNRLLMLVRKAESQSTDYKAEIIAELRAEYEAESTKSFSKITKPVAIALCIRFRFGRFMEVEVEMVENERRIYLA